MKIIILLILVLSFLTGCYYPARTIMPLETQVVDAETGSPIEKVTVLRVVCDIHDFECVHGQMDQFETRKDGNVKLSGARKWGLWIPVPGGLPVPNHYIAIWKSGYKAFVFSQYGDINSFLRRTNREDLIKAIREIPDDRKNYSPEDHPEKMFEDGKIKLYKAQQ